MTTLPPTASFATDCTSSAAAFAQLQAHVDTQLAPLVQAIDREGHYPKAWMQGYAALGGFSALASKAEGGSGHGLTAQIQRLAAVGAVCGSTAFSLWCQSASAWYLRQSSNADARQRYLPALLQGQLWAGTGLSNTVKHLSQIERHLLQAKPHEQDGQSGLLVSGGLPWVSNLDEQGHALLTAAQLPDGSYRFFVVRSDAPGLRLRACPDFSGLQGTGTMNVRMSEVWIPQSDILADGAAFEDYLQRIKPGFVLLQMGMALGVIEASIASMEDCQRSPLATNAWLDDQPQTLRPLLADLRQRTWALADLAEQGQAPLLDVLRLRLAGSELALRAAQADALHSGARGYLMLHGAQRRSREALFVAIVTPALKQLRHDIARLEGQAETAPSVTPITVQVELAEAV